MRNGDDYWMVVHFIRMKIIPNKIKHEKLHSSLNWKHIENPEGYLQYLNKKFKKIKIKIKN